MAATNTEDQARVMLQMTPDVMREMIEGVANKVTSTVINALGNRLGDILFMRPD